jgi:SMODS and SLOG-associating 2TM effector domain 1/Protein of unknown function (DUF4231)
VSDNSPADEVWRRQGVWSQVSNQMEAAIGRARTAVLAFTVAGAVFATTAATLAGPLPLVGSALAGVSAISVGLIPLMRTRATGAVLQHWTRARWVAESLKGDVYLYLARVGDYAGSDREARLIEVTDEVTGDATDLLPYVARIEPAHRELPPVIDAATYFSVRVDGQIDGYYRPSAEILRSRLAAFRRLELVLAVVGVVLGALAATFPRWGLGPWVAVVTTTTAVMATHVAAGRYEYRLVEYLRTAEELGRIRRAAARAKSAAELGGLVQRSERIISIQNESWMAKLSTTPEPEAASKGTEIT